MQEDREKTAPPDADVQTLDAWAWIARARAAAARVRDEAARADSPSQDAARDEAARPPSD